MSARREALSLLLTAEEKSSFANLLLSRRALDAAGEEAPLLTALFYGTVERRLTLDYAIGVFAERDVETLTPHTRNLLRLGLYQLYFMKIPPHAACDQTVALGENKGERALVNAVLRRAARAPMPLPPEGRRVRHLSVKHSFPTSTVRKLMDILPDGEVESLLSAFNEVSPLTVTTNLAKISRAELCELLSAAGFACETTSYSSRSVRLKTSVSPERLPGFAEGLFLVQDEASAMVAEALGAARGQRVIDTCAAPGGKILSVATALAGEGEFYAFDLHESKLPLIEESARRLGVSLHTAVCDGRVGREELLGTADRVICDVPCSGLGVLGKKPDLRYRALGDTLAPLGLAILQRSAAYLREDGILMYSTCTLTREENEDNVQAFLDANPDFYAEDFAFGELRSREGMLTLFPHRHGTDGFFMAKLHKRK